MSFLLAVSLPVLPDRGGSSIAAQLASTNPPACAPNNVDADIRQAFIYPE
jgi:hypothetical protein